MSHHNASVSVWLLIYLRICQCTYVYMFGEGYFVLSFIHEATSINFYFIFAAD